MRNSLLRTAAHRMGAGVLLAGLSFLVRAAPAFGEGSQDALQAAGPQAAHIIDLWRLTLGICVAVFSAVLVAVAVALSRSPRATRDTPPDVDALHRPERGLRHSVAWATGVSVLLLLVLLGGSFFTDRALARLALRDAVHVEVTAQQWWWDLRYDDAQPDRVFTTANELHIPVGRPVILTLKASDVIHSFWVPNLAGKKDLVPGRTATLRLQADRAGTFRGQCAEFCGLQHARMAFVVVAEPPERYEAWLAQQRRPAAPPSTPLQQRGHEVFMASTCAMCHSINGTQAGGRHAPDLTHLGSRMQLAAGALPNTQQALAAWISDPQAFKPGSNMPAHRFPAEDLQALVAYLQALQ